MNSDRLRRFGAVLMLAAGCSTGASERAADPAQPSPSAGGEERAAVPVTVAPVRRGDLVHYVAVDGEVQATRLLDMTSAAAGVVVERPAAEGGRVAAGELLVRFDCRDATLALRRAEADRQRALMQYAARGIGQADVAGGFWRQDGPTPAQFAELERQFARGLIARRDLDEARRAHDVGLLGDPAERDRSIRADVGLSAAEVAIEEAELQIERCQVRAPFGGTLAEVTVQVGQNVNPGDPLLTLVDLDDLVVEADVLETDLAGLRAGARAALEPAAEPGRRIGSRVLRISPLVDAARRVGRVTLSVARGTRGLRSGGQVRVIIDGASVRDRLIVPNAAVLYSDDRPLVMVVRDGLAQWEYVRLGESNGVETVILPDEAALHGVAEGELVVVDGNFTLAHDTPVEVAPAGGGRPSDAAVRGLGDGR